MAETKHKYRCSICGYLYDRDEIILEHSLSPICIGCLDGQELLDTDDMPVDDIQDFYEEVREIQELEKRRNYETFK